MRYDYSPAVFPVNSIVSCAPSFNPAVKAICSYSRTGTLHFQIPHRYTKSVTMFLTIKNMGIFIVTHSFFRWIRGNTTPISLIRRYILPIAYSIIESQKRKRCCLFHLVFLTIILVYYYSPIQTDYDNLLLWYNTPWHPVCQGLCVK